MIEFEVNGTPYKDFISASCKLSMKSVANEFTFTASAVNGFPPFKKGDEIQCIVDGESKLTGFVEKIKGNETDSNHTITYSGRDKTGDFIDSQLSKLDDIKASPSLTLKRIIELILKISNHP